MLPTDQSLFSRFSAYHFFIAVICGAYYLLLDAALPIRNMLCFVPTDQGIYSGFVFDPGDL
jgi:hypothetical protein